MKNTFAFLFLTMMFPVTALAQNGNAISAAQKSFRDGQFRKSAVQFYNLAFTEKNLKPQEKSAARYYLGLSLMKLKMNQAAAFPLIITTRESSGTLAQKALQNLVVVSDRLNDTGLLDYTIRKVDPNNLGEVARDLYLNRLAQTQMNKGELDQALENLAAALRLQPHNEESLYLQGLIHLKKNQAEPAIASLSTLLDRYQSRPATDPKRGLASIALARAHYQGKNFKEAIDLYREIPKDHPAYRDSQIELTWSLFRSAQFRSAMSTIQTLHTPYYENFYDPESLILRAIILLFVCQNDEADKSLQNFTRNYTQAYSQIAQYNKAARTAESNYKQIDAARRHLNIIKKGAAGNYSGEIPFFVVRTLMDRGALKNKITYLKEIEEEIKRAESLRQPSEKGLRTYIQKILLKRQANAQREAGQLLANSLRATEEELSVLSGDLNLLRYEVLNGKKKQARSEYIKKVNNGEAHSRIDHDNSRNFYISNGNRYWPFEGEYWRDEIGNYQYLGVNTCETE